MKLVKVLERFLDLPFLGIIPYSTLVLNPGFLLPWRRDFHIIVKSYIENTGLKSLAEFQMRGEESRRVEFTATLAFQAS